MFVWVQRTPQIGWIVYVVMLFLFRSKIMWHLWGWILLTPKSQNQHLPWFSVLLLCGIVYKCAVSMCCRNFKKVWIQFLCLPFLFVVEECLWAEWPKVWFGILQEDNRNCCSHVFWKVCCDLHIFLSFMFFRFVKVKYSELMNVKNDNDHYLFITTSLYFS